MHAIFYPNIPVSSSSHRHLNNSYHKNMLYTTNQSLCRHLPQSFSIYFLNNWIRRYSSSGKKQFHSWQTVIGREHNFSKHEWMNEAAVAAEWVSESEEVEAQGAFVNCVILIRLSWGRKLRVIFNRETAGSERLGVKRAFTFFSFLFLTVKNDYVGNNTHD